MSIPKFFLFKVAYMAVARHYRVVGAEKFSYGFCFGRRLNYDKVFNHDSMMRYVFYGVERGGKVSEMATATA